jgi:hypothetical protein
MREQRSLLIVAAGAALLLLCGTVVGLAAGHQSAPAYPRNSPQAAVATYLRLLQSGKFDAAFQMTDFSGQDASMSTNDFHQQYDNWSRQSHRVTLVQSQVNGDTASITVDISTFSGGAFGASDQTYRQTFTLERLPKGWLITGPEYIW